MSKIKELKTDTQNVLNLIDVLELFSPEKKSKYTDTLLRLMRKLVMIVVNGWLLRV